MDCSGIFRYETNRDYTQKLKIVDASSPTDPIQIFLYGKKEDLSTSLRVGDVLFFHKFKADIFNDNIQIKKPYKVEESFYRIFNGSPDLNNYSVVDKQVLAINDGDG